MARMKNTKLQEELDLDKFVRSYETQQDMAGMMEYCADCPNKGKDGKCFITHEQRVATSECARNHNKLKRKK